jgi:hypothetical protein
MPTGLIAPGEDFARTTYGPRKVSPPFLSILVYAQVFGVGFHAFMVPYGSILLQHTAVPLPNAR